MRQLFKSLLQLSKINSLLLALTLIVLLSTLIIWGWNGAYARFAADDYQTSFQLRDNGFFPEQVRWYLEWTGRFSLTLTHSTFLLFGPAIVQVLPTILLLLLISTWFFISMRCFTMLNAQNTFLQPLVMAFIIVFGLYAALPNLRQVLFWLPGISNYSIPMLVNSAIFLVILNACLSYKNNLTIPRRDYLLISLLSFFGTAFTESYIPIYLTTFSLFLLGSLLIKNNPARKRIILFFTAGLTFTILSAIIVIIAPGNALRQAGYPPHPELFTLIKMTLKNIWFFFRQQLTSYSAILAFVAVIALYTGFTLQKQKKHPLSKANLFVLGLLPLIFISLIVLVFLTTYWATSAYPAPRTLSTPQFFLVLGLASAGFFAGFFLQDLISKHSAAVTILLLVLGFLLLFIGPVQYNIKQIQEEIPTAQLFASQWDERDAFLRQAAIHKEKYVGVRETINYYDVEQLFPRTDEYRWMNWAMSQYYQIYMVFLEADAPE